MLKLQINQHTCSISGLNPEQYQELKKLLSFPIAQAEYIRKYHLAKARADKNYTLIQHWKEWNALDCKLEGNTFPIGLKFRVTMWLHLEDPYFQTIDMRKLPVELPEDQRIKFKGKLFDFQEYLVKDTEFADRGIYNLGTGGGKTIIGIYLMASRNVKTIVVVPNLELVNQWIKRIQEFTEEPRSLGFYSRGQFRDGNIIVINQGALQKALKGGAKIEKTKQRHEAIRKRWFQAGMVLIDECHKAGTDKFVEVMSQTNAYYVYGFSPVLNKRHDKKDIEYYSFIGEALKVMNHKQLEAVNMVTEIRCWFHEVPYRYYHKGWDYHIKGNEGSIYWDYIVTNPYRNNIALNICTDRGFRKEKQTLVLVKRVQHGKLFLHMVRNAIDTRPDLKYLNLVHKKDYAYLHGEISIKKRRPILDRFIDNKMNLLIAQHQLLGEGWDVPSIRVIFVLMGDKSPIQKINNMGRGSRKFRGKEYLELHDFADQARIVQQHSEKRALIYEEEGVELMNVNKTFLAHLFN